MTNKLKYTFAYLLGISVIELYKNTELVEIGVLPNGNFFADFSNIKIDGEMLDEISQKMSTLASLDSDLESSSQLLITNISQYLPKEEIYKKYFLSKFEKNNVLSSKEINSKAFKLTNLSAVYFKNNKANIQLRRIEGVGFETPLQLRKYLTEAKISIKNDHRTLGKQLDLFIFSKSVGSGLPLYTPKGAALKRAIEKMVVEQEILNGYQHVETPELASIELYKKSGHYPYYKDSMYSPIDIDGKEYILRPMSCPHHFELYLSKPRSYKELPMKIAELAKLFRYEKSGELIGLTRVRSFCLSDAHIICADKEQVKEEIKLHLDFIVYLNEKLGFKHGEDFWYRLSLGDKNNTEKYYENDEAWSEAENVLRSALEEKNINFVEAQNEAAFYGPKIDIQMKTNTGKEDTAYTIQYDFVMPERFNLEYVGADGKKHRPIVLHRSSIGAIERVIAFLIEKYKGDFPFWMSPVQAKIITINDSVDEYATEIYKSLLKNQIRVELDLSKGKLGEKIYKAKKEKINHVIIIGEKNKEESTITLDIVNEEKTDITINEYLDKVKQLNI